VAKSVPFFFKQWGGVHKKRYGRLLQGRTWDEMPNRTRFTEGFINPLSQQIPLFSL
jgi:hypothetical protein